MVKGKKNSRHAVSDWMEIEKQRGSFGNVLGAAVPL